MDNIYSARIAQADTKGFKEAMGKLRQQERVVEMNRTRREGGKVRAAPQTPQERIWMEAREHLRLVDLPIEQQSEFEQERQKMWNKIPEHLRPKAEKLAGK